MSTFRVDQVSASRTNSVAAKGAADGLFQRVFEQTTLGLCLFDTELRFLHVNAALATINGRAVEEHLGHTLREVIGEAAEVVEPCYRHVLTTGEPMLAVEVQGEVPHDPGRLRSYRVDIYPLQDAAGVVLAVGAVVQDVTAEKEAEAGLMASRRQFQELLEDIAAVVWEFDLKLRRHTYVSPLVEPLLGYPPADWYQDEDLWQRLVYPQDRATATEFSRRQLAAGCDHTQEFRMVARDGRVVWVHEDIRLVRDGHGEVTHLRGVVTDITQRKAAEETLRHSEARYRVLVDSAPVCIHEIELDGTLASINATGRRMLGNRSESELLGMPMWAFVVAEDLERVQELFERACQGAATEFEFRTSAGPGTRVFWSCFIPLRDDSEQVGRIMGISDDITQRKHAEQSLRDSEQRYRTLVENAPEAILVIDATTWSCLEYNENAKSLFGLSDEQMGDFGAMSPQSLPALVNELCQAVSPHSLERALRGELPIMEWTYPSAVGGEIPCEVRLVRVPSSTHQLVRLSISDIRVRKRAERELREKELQLAHVSRLSTMGELVAGIAHEVSQPLYAIQNYARAGRNSLATASAAATPSLGAGLAEWLDEIIKATERAGQIIRRLRDFNRQATQHTETVPLNQIIQEAVELLGFQARHSQVHMQFRLVEPSPLIVVDRIQVQQVIINLLMNAFEATGQVAADSRRVIVSTEIVHDQVRVSVIDSGPGLPAHKLDKLFDAFVTTKPQGMGMGLAISHTIITAHQGSIWADADYGPGARLCFTLPIMPLNRTPESEA